MSLETNAIFISRTVSGDSGPAEPKPLGMFLESRTTMSVDDEEEAGERELSRERRARKQ